MNESVKEIIYFNLTNIHAICVWLIQAIIAYEAIARVIKD